MVISYLTSKEKKIHANNKEPSRPSKNIHTKQSAETAGKSES